MINQDEPQISSRSVWRSSQSSPTSATVHTPRSFQSKSEKDLLNMINEIFQQSDDGNLTVGSE